LKVRLFEIFTSVEGEGILYGTKTLFVRLAGCPFTCFYCDTKESLPLDSGKEYDIQEVILNHLALTQIDLIMFYHLLTLLKSNLRQKILNLLILNTMKD
jgi:organic radical activating enzyme